MEKRLDEISIKKLMDAARKASALAYPSVSDLKVGAAILSDDGEIFCGANIETPSLLFVICAERVALIEALLSGKRNFRAIAVYSPDIKNISPCGICRQTLFEIDQDITIIMGSEGKSLIMKSIKELLPSGFLMPE